MKFLITQVLYQSISLHIFPNINFFVLYSPYACSNCYHSNFEIVNDLAKKYPNQVYLLAEYWEARDVVKGIQKINLNHNVKLILDKDGKILNFRSFKNFGSFDTHLNITSEVLVVLVLI
jgi:hypothetical protein